MKRIITCSDGTWNSPGAKDRGKIVLTNVERLYRLLDTQGVDATTGKLIPQVSYYDTGVGTGYSWYDKYMGGATGAGIDKNIQDAYKFIMWNYEPGDEIFLFGFSRGAYTARSVGGFIRTCGVLKPQHLHLVEEAYQLYRDKTGLTHPESHMMESFKKCYSYTPRIRFIGVWDTVGSLGIPLHFYQIFNKGKYEFHDVTLSKIVDYAYHALGIHERRKIFSPTLWERSKNASPSQVLEQAWFTGVHSNIGGGYCDCGLSDITLQWMIDKASHPRVGLGVNLKDADPPIKPDPNGELRNSITGIYNLAPKQWRTICKDKNGCETIHESVKQRKDLRLPPGMTI